MPNGAHPANTHHAVWKQERQLEVANSNSAKSQHSRHIALTDLFTNRQKLQDNFKNNLITMDRQFPQPFGLDKLNTESANLLLPCRANCGVWMGAHMPHKSSDLDESTKSPSTKLSIAFPPTCTVEEDRRGSRLPRRR